MEESTLYLHDPTELSLSPRKRRRCALDVSEVRKCNKLDKHKRKPISDFKWGNATVGDAEFEEQDQGEKREMVTSRAKRTKCTYSLENANVLEKPANPESLDFPPFMWRTDDSSPKSTAHDSSASNSEDPAPQPSNRKILLLLLLTLYIIVLSFSSEFSLMLLLIAVGSKSHKDRQTFNVKGQNRDADNRKTGEYLDLGIEKLHQSSFASTCVEATDSFLDPDNQDVMDIMLVDVQLTVLASPGARNAPFVSLTSEAYGVAVLGYQLDVGEIQGASEPVLLSEESGDRWSRFDQLVWRTSKRTPVCYVSSSLSASISKNVLSGPVREKSLLRKGKSPMKLQKNRKQFDQGKPAPKKTCVPVELIFSKILAAVN